MKNATLAPDLNGKLVTLGAHCIGRIYPTTGRRWGYNQIAPWREAGPTIYGETKSLAAAVAALVDAAIAEGVA